MTSDNLHWFQWWSHSGSEAEVSAYFTPQEWWSMGTDALVAQIQELYKQFILACDGHVELKKPKKASRRLPPTVVA